MSDKQVAKDEKEPVDKIEYELYSDYWLCAFKKGMFVITFGQAMYDPPQMRARIWVDAGTMKKVIEDLRKVLDDYEKKCGKVELTTEAVDVP